VLIVLVRLVFVVVLVLAGLGSAGRYFFDQIAGIELPPWFGTAMAFAIAVTLIAAEQAFRRRFTRSLVAFLLGLSAGLALSWLLISVLDKVITDQALLRNLNLPVAVITCYLVLITVLRNADRLRLVLPFVEFRAEQSAGATVLDGSLLGDGRLPALAASGVLGHRLLLPRRALGVWEAQVADADPGRQARARRALEILTELRTQVQVDIDATELPAAAEDPGEMLIGLARLEGARIAAADRDLCRRAKAQGLPVLDVTALAAVLAPPPAKPGDVIELLIDKAGEGKGQGVGTLDDGSLAVVNDAADAIGSRVRATVVRMHVTSNGRMLFCTRS
jgi:uncharacterized protein YacL